MPQRHRSIVSELANLLRAAAHAHSQSGGAQAGGGGGSVRWGGQQFENAPALVAWINAHGGHQTVPGFLSTHPAAAAQFAGGGRSRGAGAGGRPDLSALLAGVGGGSLAVPPPPALIGPPVQMPPGGAQYLGPPAGIGGGAGTTPPPPIRIPPFGPSHLMALLGHRVRRRRKPGLTGGGIRIPPY